MKTKIFILLLFVFVGIFLTQCNLGKNKKDLEFRNITEDAHYVGMAQCRSCHNDVYQSFMQTGMGLSFDTASKQKSKAFFNEHALVYDSANQLYYKPYWENEVFKVMEFKMQGSDTIHKRLETVDYIIGSGHHTNSHMYQVNGFLYQIPITFYVQQQKWDLAPGFENGANTRFNRSIKEECMTCHNGLPQMNPAAENRYENIAHGIDCERCHGPGSIHVAEKLKGIVVDTSKQADLSIVNPRRLSTQKQMELCQRCHLQGVAVLAEGKTFSDFKPSMNVNQVFDVFLPRFQGEENNFIMASQADRLKMSQCYQAGNLSCITCHNPHVNIKNVGDDYFNSKCTSCHTSTDAEIHGKPKGQNCIQCHMPKSGSIDIPHVSITDHYIRKDYSKSTNSNDNRFKNLACLTTEKPSDLLIAKGYLRYFEGFNSSKALLDSAQHYLNEVKNKESMEYLKTSIHASFLKEDYASVIKSSQRINKDSLNYFWTAYYIGQSYNHLGDYKNALSWIQKAINMKPDELEILISLADLQLKTANGSAADKTARKIISLNNRQEEAYVILCKARLFSADFEGAKEALQKAVDLNPDKNKYAALQQQIKQMSGR